MCVSLSARRAWIEIELAQAALKTARSLSARRAWIEIIGITTLARFVGVALRKESVDRNEGREAASRKELGRSPQGERG